MDYFQIINDCKYLNLSHISEIESNVLKLLIQEAVPSEAKEDWRIDGLSLKDVHQITSTNECRKFEITFQHYIAYSIRNESFARQDENEKYKGHVYRIYESSSFLDYIQKATFASGKYPGKFKHYGLQCSGHIVDVVSSNEPYMRMYH